MSRNRGKPTIRHLTTIKPTKEDRDKLLEAAINSHPITAAILGAVFVEHELEQIIRNRLPKIDDASWNALLQDNGPLATLNQKILLGAALKIYDKETKENLKIISNVRNAFAHSKRLIDFSHPLVQKEIMKVAIPNFHKRDHRHIKELKFGAKDSYIILCIVISTHLTKRYVESLKGKTQRLRKKIPSPFYGALIGSLGSNSLSNQQLFPQNHTAGPNPPIQGGLLDGLSHLFDPSTALANLGKKK